MGDVSDFLRELPSKAALYEELLNSVRLFKYTCSKRFDVVQLEQLRQKIEKDELPLLGLLWESSKLMDRFVKHHGTNYNIQPAVLALAKFKPLFEEKTVFGTPKIIHLSNLQLKSLPKDHYNWQRFNKLFEVEKKVLEKSKNVKVEPVRQTRTGFMTSLSGKNITILAIILILASGGLFNLFAGQNKPSDTTQVKTYDLNNKIFEFMSNNGNRNIQFFNDGYKAMDAVSYEEFVRQGDMLQGSNGTTVLINDKELVRYLDYLKSTQPVPQPVELSAKEYFDIGMQFYDAQKYDEALVRFDNAANKDSANSEYWKYAGISTYRLNNYDDAIIKLSKSAELNASDSETYYFIGNAYNKKGDKENALLYWKKSADLGNQKAKQNYDIIKNGQ